MAHKQSLQSKLKQPLPNSSMITHLVRIIPTFQKTNKLLVQTGHVLGVAATFQNWQSAAITKKWEKVQKKQHSLSSINIFNHKGKGRFKQTFAFYLM